MTTIAEPICRHDGQRTTGHDRSAFDTRRVACGSAVRGVPVYHLVHQREGWVESRRARPGIRTGVQNRHGTRGSLWSRRDAGATDSISRASMRRLSARLPGPASLDARRHAEGTPGPYVVVDPETALLQAPCSVRTPSSPRPDRAGPPTPASPEVRFGSSSRKIDHDLPQRG